MRADNDIELWELTLKSTKDMKDLIMKVEVQPQATTSEDLPMHELLGLDKKLRSIRDALKMETVQKVQSEQHFMQEEHKFAEIHNIQDYTDMQ